VDSLRALAGRLDEAAATLTAAAHTVAVAGPPYPAFPVDAPGRLADLGHALHEQWAAATEARAREAAALAVRLTDAAATLRLVAANYADTDDAARRRHPEEA
jgi:hypothetical protein